MNVLKKSIIVVALVFMGLTSAQAAGSFSLSVGTDDFYLSVGNYDYLPYSYDVNPGYVAPRINFIEVMADYGNWVYVPTFGQVWRPYVDSSWRPYSYGHWIYTSYGPTWQGYEPWAWAAYHYGNWIFDQRYGWVWIPGYDWTPGNVVWSRSYDTIGWMPAPPRGYDYSRGYLYYRGNENQFTYDDPNFFDDDYGYGGGYYNQGYDDFYNPNYTNVSINLWVFINQNHYGYNNYADYYLDRDYTRDVFRRRMVRINSKPIQRAQLERVTRTRINEVPVRVKEFDTDKRRVKMVIPEGEEENIRKNANKVVQNVIAPAFAEKQKPFRGLKSTNEKNVARIFNQENKAPKIETVSSEVVINKAKENNKRRDDERLKVTRQEIEKVDKVEKEVKAKNNNQTPKSKPSTVTEPSVKVPANQDVKTKPSSNLNSQQPKQNASPNTKPKQTENPYVKPQNEPSNTNKDRDAQFTSDKDKNKSKDVNSNQNPYAEEERIKKQSEDRIKQADQNKKRAEEQVQQADDSKKKAQDQLRKANEDPSASSEKMKQDAESQIEQADQEKQSAEEQIENAEKTKQQAEEDAKQADENTKKKKSEQTQKKKDKDKDKKPPRQSF